MPQDMLTACKRAYPRCVCQITCRLLVRLTLASQRRKA